MKKTNTERSQKHREKRPHSGAADKAKQRQKESVIRFHIVRKHISKIAIPDWVDQNSDVFARVKATYDLERSEPLEVYHG